MGTSSVKVAVFAAPGQIAAIGAAQYPILHPQPGHAEQDPARWWAAVVEATRQVTKKIDTAAVVAIGLSGQMHGTVLLDDDDAPLGNAIIWPDQRSARQVEEITELIGAQELIRITGSPVATGFQAATIRWLQEEEPARWAKTEKALMPKDYLRWRMTGAFATDPSDGSGALLLDVRTRDWSSELLTKLEIEPERLPPVQPSTGAAGALLPHAAAELNLPSGIPVITGAADTACSAAAAGVAARHTPAYAEYWRTVGVADRPPRG